MPESQYCLETKSLSYSYSGNDNILNGIELQVAKGSIYGFLGPNGAGKTTTLRLLLGLLKLQQGSISIFGSSLQEQRIEILRKVGSLIESPSLYGHLTAEENLELLRRIYRCPKENVYQSLELVGLASTGKKKAGQFSLGMKQRLSLAIALLHKPELLILDEPTNGLDPNGIIEMRTLLKRLNQEQKITILVSSHLLAEIEKLVTHVGIIHRGTLRFQGTLTELNAQKQQGEPVTFETDNVNESMQIIQANGFAGGVEDGKIIVTGLSKTETAFLNAEMVRNNINVYRIAGATGDLEKIFMDVINN
jgi:ABC-type multidrug transport system ATPase subunit